MATARPSLPRPRPVGLRQIPVTALLAVFRAHFVKGVGDSCGDHVRRRRRQVQLSTPPRGRKAERARIRALLEVVDREVSGINAVQLDVAGRRECKSFLALHKGFYGEPSTMTDPFALVLLVTFAESEWR